MTMLTSLPPCVHGVLLWDTNTPGRVLNPAVHTLAEVLKNAGWATAAFTGGSNVHRSRGFGDGFDEYKHSGQLARATEWITRHRGRKWFVFFHTFDVHDPYLPPEPLVARFDGDYRGPVRDAVARLRARADGWERAHELFWASVDRNDAPTVRFVSRLYDAAIRHMDETTIAPLLDLLDRLDLSRNTIVVFTSDHGEAFGEHGRFLLRPLRRAARRSSCASGTCLPAPFRGARPPPRRDADDPGARRRRRAAAVEGRSLVHAGSVAGRRRASTTTSASADLPARAAPARLHRRRPDGAFFDLVHDPGEADDLAARRPRTSPRCAPCSTAGARVRSASAPRPTGAAVRPDEETRKRLRALGYVE
jgi:arylsulfatase A-like enzyme